MPTVVLDMTRLQQIRNGIGGRRGDYLFDLALECERDTKQSFGASPSAPGEPPGVDTGTLRASVQAERIDDKTSATNVGTDYSVYLEYGTSKMAARPFLLPATERTARKAGDQGFAAKVVTG